MLPDFQTDFEEAASQLPPALTRLSLLISDNPVQKHLADEMLPLIDQRIEEFRKTIELARTQHIDDAARIVREGIGRDAMKHIEDLAGQMRAEEDRLFGLRNLLVAAQVASAMSTAKGASTAAPKAAEPRPMERIPAAFQAVQSAMAAMQAAAGPLKLQLEIATVQGPSEFSSAFAALTKSRVGSPLGIRDADGTIV